MVAAFIVLSAYLNLLGWGLSAIHQLNAAGYGLAMGASLLFAAVMARRTGHGPKSFLLWLRARIGRARRVLRKGTLPRIFLAAAGAIALGGLLHAPNNYDAMTYRLPRVLHWLAEERWHWIFTANGRMNYSGTGWEWLALPQLALLGSDRGLFAVNLSAFLMLPGLVFSLLRRFGVAWRVAWIWMWVLPLGYGFALQAGSVGNDLLGVFFCLASLRYGLKARQSSHPKDLWLAILAAALLTSVKLSNLPLALPCMVALAPALPIVRQRWLGSIAALAVALVVSIAPTLALNRVHAGGFTGDPRNQARLAATHPVAGIVGNGLLATEQALLPPVLPAARRVQQAEERGLPAPLRRLLEAGFPRYRQRHLNELPQEESAGLGMGVTLLLLVPLLAGMVTKHRHALARRKLRLPYVTAAAYLALLVYAAKMGSESAGRLLLPYYPALLAPLLLFRGHAWLAAKRAGRAMAVLAALAVAPALVLSPSRPLWPAATATRWLASQPRLATAAQRMSTVYSVYAERNDLLAELRAGIPADVHEVGALHGSDESDYALWRPFGGRKVVELWSERDPTLTVPQDLRWLVIQHSAWALAATEPLHEWVARQHGASVVATAPIRSKVSQPAALWSVVHLAEAPR